MVQIIDGKKISQEIKDELREKVSTLKAQGKTICLAEIGRASCRKSVT